MEESAETRRERLRAMRDEAEHQQNDELGTSHQMLLPPPLLSEEHPSDAAAGTPGFNFYTEPMSGFKRKPALLPSHGGRGPSVPFHHNHHRQQQQQQQQRPQWVAYQQQPEFVTGLHQPAGSPAPFGFVAPGLAPFPGLAIMEAPPDMPISRGGRGERFGGNSNNRGGRGERFGGNSNNRGGRGERFNGNSSRGRGRGRYSSRGFYHQQSATQGGQQYFKKWMLDDPWKDLTPKPLP